MCAFHKFASTLKFDRRCKVWEKSKLGKEKELEVELLKKEKSK